MNGEHPLHPRHPRCPSRSRCRRLSPGDGRRPRRGARAAAALAALLAAGGLLGPPPARGEFDGRLPATISSPLDPERRLPEPARAFLAAHAEDYLVFWDHALETPRLLAARDLAAAPSLLELAGLAGESAGGESGSATGDRLAEAARAFIERHRAFFGVGAGDLDGPEVFRLGDHRLVLFGQQAGGIGVRGASIRLLVTAGGRLAMVKSFLLRDAAASLGPALPPAPDPAATAAILERFKASRDVAVLGLTPQLLFPDADPERAAAVARVVIQTEDDEPAEVLIDLASGEPLEERRFIEELGIVEGDIHAHYPTPDPRHPNFFFTEPGNMRDHPVAGVLLVSSIDAVVTDEDGHFSIAVTDGGSEIVWSLLGGECPEQNLIAADIPEEEARRRERANLVCNVATLGLTRAFDVEFSMLVDPFICSDPTIVVGTPRVVQVGEPLVLDLNPSTRRDMLASGRLMAFRHTDLFLEHSRAVTRGLGIAVPPLPPLAVHIISDSIARRHYLASNLTPRICFALDLREPQQIKNQPLTPTLLNHEIAHHLLFELTNHRHGSLWDCYRQVEQRENCMEEGEDSLGEPAVVEGVVDALAAYYADTPLFGFVDEGRFGGALAYDISTGEDPNLRDAMRRAVGKMLWDLRRNFVSIAGRDSLKIIAQKASAEGLLYRWIAFSRCFDDTSRAFEFGPCLLAELRLLESLDGDEKHRRAIEAAFDNIPLLADMPFIRGDANLDGRSDLADPIFTLAYLFLGGGHRGCDDAMDSNDDGAIAVADGAFSLNHLFLAGPRPAAPFPDCGRDHTEDALRCEEAHGCAHVIAGWRPGGGGE